MVTKDAHVPLVESVGDELRALLSPITPETFVREYWAKKPLFVKGFRDKYKGFFDGETLIGALSMPGPAPEDFLRASFDKKTGSPSAKAPDEWASVAFRASLEQAVPLFKAGATLCVTQIETRVPALVPFLAAIKRQLGYPGKVCFNAYLSPPFTGFNWHFDGRIASTLQIEGSKRWRFSNGTAVSWPHSNGVLRADGKGQYTDSKDNGEGWKRLAPFDEKDTTEVLLEPGDLLILPAGTWHDACGGAGGSLALNLSFTAVSYTVLVQNLLDTILTPDPGWRAPSPVLPLSGGLSGQVDPEGVASITAQLVRAADALRSLAGDDAAVVRLWASFVQNPNPGSPAPPSPQVATTPVLPTQRLRIRADRNVYAMVADGGSRLYVAVGTSGGGVEVTGEAVPFVQRMLAEKEFIAGDCLGWSDNPTPFAWSDVEMLLTKLTRDGLIEAASGAR
jgi:hypothetical protein